MKRYYLFFALLAIFCAGAVLVNNQIRQGPVHDSQVIEDLSTISTSISTYASDKQSLPTELSALTLSNSKIKQRLRDYTYTRKSRDSYELCATFMTKRTESNDSYVSEGEPDTSIHTTAKNCFNNKLQIMC